MKIVNFYLIHHTLLVSSPIFLTLIAWTSPGRSGTDKFPKELKEKAQKILSHQQLQKQKFFQNKKIHQNRKKSQTKKMQ